MTLNRPFQSMLATALFLCLSILGIVDAGATAATAAMTPSSTPILVVEGGIFLGPDGIYSPPVMSGDGRWIVYTSGPVDALLLHRLDRTSGATITIAGPGPLRTPAVSADGTFVAFTESDQVKFWDGRTGVIQTLNDPGTVLNGEPHVSISDDGNRVAWTDGLDQYGDNRIWVWTRTSNSRVQRPGRPTFRLSGNGRFVLYVDPTDQSVHRWDLASGSTRTITSLDTVSDDGNVSGSGVSLRDDGAFVGHGIHFDWIDGSRNDWFITMEDSLMLNPPFTLVSGDGRSAIFPSTVPLVPEDSGTTFDLYRADLTTRTLQRVVVSRGTVVGLTDDGRYGLLVDYLTDSSYSIALLDFSLERVPVDLLERPQLTDQVSRLYRAYFRRDPDADGLRYWTARRAGGTSLLEVSANFATSPEFISRYGSLGDAAFVNLVYENVLGRAPDPAGLDYWIGQLRGGLSRGALFIGFSESPEFIRHTATTSPSPGAAAAIYRLYWAYYLRSPDQGGLDHWYNLARLGTPLTAISDIFAVTPEFQTRYGRLTDAQFVDLIYTNVLGRLPDDAGRTFWTGRLAAGWTRGRVMLEFSESPEFIVRTNTMPG